MEYCNGGTISDLITGVTNPIEKNLAREVSTLYNLYDLPYIIYDNYFSVVVFQSNS